MQDLLVKMMWIKTGNKKISFNSIKLGTLFFILFFSRYLEIQTLSNFIILGLSIPIVLKWVVNFKIEVNKNSFIFGCLCASYVVLFVVNCLIISEHNSILFSNLRMTIYTYAFAIVLLDCLNSLDVGQWLKRRFNMIVLMWFANLFVLLMQIQGNGFMIKSKWLEKNSFYEDQCSGLFGNSGTHELGYFIVFMTLFFLYYIATLRDKTKKNFWLWILLISNILMIIASTQNDNISIYLFVGIFVLVFFMNRIAGKYKDNRTVFTKYIKGVFYILMIAAMLLLIPQVREIISDLFQYKLMKILRFKSAGMIRGGNERLAIAYNALENGYGWLLGKGLGAASFYSSVSVEGFTHFGISSVGTIVYLCGIWVYILQLLIWTSIVNRLSLSNEGCLKVVNFIVLMALSMYSDIFSSLVSIGWILMSFALIGENRKIIQISSR